MYFSAKDLKAVLLAERPKGLKGAALFVAVNCYILVIQTVALGILVSEKARRVFRNLSRVFKD